ncbi:MAG: hypothetical protein FWG47_02130 [Propionibacteriaceae bacterium]|nr:hypothetical protein [Propionibacteriaceae bacterium]
MSYDPERSPGRSHETAPKQSPATADTKTRATLGAVATYMSQTGADVSSNDASDLGTASQSPESSVQKLTQEAISQARDTRSAKADLHAAEASALALTTNEVRAGSPALQTKTTSHTIGGGMSLQDTIAQIASLQRAIQDQIRLINDFLKSNRDTMQIVRTELKGSTKGYDQRMINSLSQAESSLTSSLSSLQRASEALTKVSAI